METTTTNYLAAALLDCGYMDIDYIESQIEEHNLDMHDAIDGAKDAENINANGLISQLQYQFANNIAQKFGINLQEGKHYTTYQNCLDSHVEPDEDECVKSFGKRKGKQIYSELGNW